MVGPDIERMAADVLAVDGCHATCGRETRLDPLSYAQTILASIVER